MNANDIVLGVECALPPGFSPYDESSPAHETSAQAGDAGLRLMLVVNRNMAEAVCA